MSRPLSTIAGALRNHIEKLSTIAPEHLHIFAWRFERMQQLCGELDKAILEHTLEASKLQTELMAANKLLKELSETLVTEDARDEG